MTKEQSRKANKYQRAHKRRTLWHRVVSVLSAVTVFITTYALILPAITMEPSPGINLERTFYHENDGLYMAFHVKGRAEFQNSYEEIQTPDPEKVELKVTPLEEESSAYAEYVQYAEENIGPDDLYDLQTVRLQFHYEGAALNVSNCEITAQIVAKPELLNTVHMKSLALEGSSPFSVSSTPAQPESGTEVMAITAYQGVSTDLSQQDTAYLDQSSNLLALDTALEGSTMAVAMYSTVNPTFTVQYYSHFTVFDSKGDISIDVIDTSGGKLPTNTASLPTKPVYLNRVGTSNRYTMATHLELAPLYSEKTFQYVQAPSVIHMDRLRENGNYELFQIWVLKEGKNPASIQETDWTIYPNNISFTNRAESATATRVYLAEGTVLRFVYNEHSGHYVNENVQFFDYDITDGDIHDANGRAYVTSRQDSGIWYAQTYLQGINKFTGTAGTAKFGYGNVNTNSGLGAETWNGNTLNQYNRSSYKGCTFGMVTGFNSDGSLKFANGISAPNMFGTSVIAGKTQITGKTLDFIRTGDTYVLNAVGNTTTTGLQYFNNPTYVNASGTTVLHSHIFTNNFWPMDSAWTWGANGHDLIFGDAKLLANRKHFQSNVSTSGSFPVGDDGKDHNSYFGMKYEIKFTLSEDYMGPLEYMFYGDDDMWVFLDGKLVCDIGGVHSSVGQYVDLWDYLVKGEDHSEHTLTFYYTERGASGSTCYMQFTLPSVDTDTPQIETNTLELGKQVINSDTTREFEFTIHLTDSEGNPLVDDYSYTRYDSNGAELEVGILNATENTVRIRGGEKLQINYLPEGTKFTITEETVNGFTTVYSINGSPSAEGNVAAGDMATDMHVLFTNSTSVILPATGGTGWLLYTLPLGTAFSFMLSLPLLERAWNKRRRAA